MGVFIIAEAGVNHNGSLDLALKLCDAAKQAGADAVKFQTFKTENMLTRNTEMAAYQKENIGSEKSQFEMLKDLELSFNDFRKIKNYCDTINVTFLSTADEEESLDFLLSLNIPFIKIGSGELSDIPFLRTVGSRMMPVVLSTGMAYISDVEIAYRELVSAGAQSVSMLHCTTNYPCPMEEVNLRAMQTLQHTFGVKVGYSDHTIGITVPVAAVAMGAQILEKHLTLDRSLLGPDHKASADPETFTKMVAAVRDIEAALGDGIKRPNKSEVAIMPVIQKCLVAACTIKRGDIFTKENITVKRSGMAGILSRYWDIVIGKKATKDYSADETIEW
jgi:N,N'-diacetyllegionaminate synthase